MPLWNYLFYNQRHLFAGLNVSAFIQDIGNSFAISIYCSKSASSDRPTAKPRALRMAPTYQRC